MSNAVCLRPAVVLPQIAVISDPEYVVGCCDQRQVARKREHLAETRGRATADRHQDVGANLARC